ncbi:uncharacterized protein NECHADRAFT_80269 [Fusarium vanettenii 77-13-4]|uniref:Helicase ATP-binding domain-containing protein n=1 Tax=Fusarium vanettenii (strain ATCC MYA-4622 / CBS 123669 / FGSC 9596 / NRRL 45880 / 77-13-4) TaxID=660122 RepID=C7YR51_FUSV7|nr:uncharacterized protein NECHADRAFT_80269 [Fusarium vanettenii 77-13-4]EEU45395.1 predicted protein [Fusarium vanettenii 77-13-4]
MPSSRRKLEEEQVPPWEPGRYMFDIEAENARAAQNRRNEREGRGGQSETAASSNEAEGATDDCFQLQHLVTRKSDNPQPMMVGIGETSVHFLDLLKSPEFLQALNHLTASDTGPTILPRLQTELKPWQAVGVTKLLQSTESMFKGALLCDEAGMGKSLTALTAALIKRKQMLPRCGFVLVVCPAEGVHPWCSEIKKHFKKDDRPSYIILDSDNIRCDQLLQFEVVICSTSFLVKKFVDHQEFVCFYDTIHALDMPVAQQRFLHQKLVHPKFPLHSELYKIINRNIAVLILDESHIAHDESTLLNAAVRSLEYHHAFLISGTLRKSSWRDLAGQSMILPGSPIQNMEKFDEIFKTAQLTSVDGDGSMQTAATWNMLSRYFMGQIVSRPSSVPPIPDCTMQVTVPSEPQDRLMYLKITFLVLEGKKLIKDPKTVSRGLAILKKAQQLACHPAVCSHHAISIGIDENLTVFHPFAEFETDVMKKLDFFLDSCFEPDQAVNDGMLMEMCNSSDSLPLGQPLYGPWPKDAWKQLDIRQRQLVTDGKAKLSSMTADEFSRFKKYLYSQPCAFNKWHLFLRLGLNHDDVESTNDRDTFSTPELLDSQSSVCSDDLKAAEDFAYQDEGFKNYGNIHDDRQALSNNSKQGTKGTKRSNYLWTKKWQDYVYYMEEDEYMSPRVRAIASKIAELHRQHQDEKVIVASTSVLFLDIISRVIDVRDRYLRIVRYDGSVKLKYRAVYVDDLNRPVDMAKKVELLDALSIADEGGRGKLLCEIMEAEGCRVLLLDAHVAGPSLSLTGASRIIFCEKFWTPGLEEKVIGCVRQFPQEKPVHVYQFFDEMSDIDLLVKDMVRDEHEPTQDVTAFFRRMDTDVVQVPEVSTREEHSMALEKLSENKVVV